LISVIMPVHNAGPYLTDAIVSILNQKNVLFELIVVDDHSTDQAINNLDTVIREDQRLIFITAESRGVVAAMKSGFLHARGEYIARMDADDIALPDRLEKQYEYLQQYPDIGIAGGQVRIFSDKEVEQGFSLYEKWLNQLCLPEDIERELFVESPIPNPTAFFRREIYQALNGYHDPEWAEDYDMWLRAHAMGIKMGKPEGVILHWRDHEKRLTHCDGRYNNKLFLKAKACYLADHPDYLKNRKAIIWGTGPNGVYLYDILKQQGVEVEAFIEVNPRRVGGIKRGKPVIHFTGITQYTAHGDASALIIGAVGARGARAKMRQALLDMDKKEGRDFLFAA
ncbi:MAG: glycosyltransferase family 2 protein, partial [Gammaproteobacteria bacterium]|nr:glycosyltransferase family 2 protein [Gammaproteobacteria bacterium]